MSKRKDKKKKADKARNESLSRAAESVAITLSPRSLAGGRASVDTEDTVFSSALEIMSPVTSEEYWRDYSLDSRTLDRISTTRLMELLADVSPDVSNGLWQFMRFCDPGFEVKAFRVGSDVIDEKAQAALESFIHNLHGPYVVSNTVPIDVIIGQMFLSAFMRGAFVSELVLDQSGRSPLEIATPDPATIKFKRINDPARGPVWQPGQWQAGKFVELNRPTFSYIPIDPMPGKPQGRAIAAPALFSCLFLIGLLHDLRRVIAQQGYPRLDVSIDLPMLLQMMPSDKSSPDAKKAWVDACTAQVQTAYNALQPDDAYVHSSHITVNKPVGTLDSSSLAASDGIIKALERFTIRALKSQPILMGAESVDQASSNRQWEVHAASIKSVQHYCEFMLERQCTLALQVQGIAANVEWRFAELRGAELLRDEQYRRLNNINTAFEYDRGWISQDEAALKATKKEKADQEEPRAKGDAALSGVPTGETASDPGSERVIKTDRSIDLESEAVN